MTAQTPRSTVAAFAADPASSAQARKFVRDSLSRMGVAAGVIDMAVLVASELVTNAVLHAHAGPVITVHIEGDLVRLEVEDSSEMFPLLRDYGSEAATGRGFRVIEATASNWGVETTQNGKTVWAEFCGDEKPAVSSDTHSDIGPQSVSEGAESDRRVEYRDVPVELYLQLEQYNEALLREFNLLRISADNGHSVIPSEVFALLNEIRPVLTSRVSSLRPQIAAARTQGLSHCDLMNHCNASMLTWTRSFQKLMTEADRLTQEGLLLAAPPSQGVVELRGWFVDETVRQFVDHLPPRPAPVFNR